jgi:hypothetical protein
MKMTPKKRNPADATIRNIKASKTRDEKLLEELKRLNRRLRLLEQDVREIQVELSHDDNDESYLS